MSCVFAGTPASSSSGTEAEDEDPIVWLDVIATTQHFGFGESADVAVVREAIAHSRKGVCVWGGGSSGGGAGAPLPHLRGRGRSVGEG